MAQTAPNLVMDLEDADCQVKYLTRDRAGKYPALSNAILADAGIDVVLSDVHTPRMNPIIERWVPTCRHESSDHTLIRNQQHHLHALHQYKLSYNTHRQHQGIANPRPLTPSARTDHRPGPARPPQHPPT